MPIIKEKRAFFLRNIQVSTGSDADKESGFPVSYFVKGIKKFNRFLKDNVPSESVFKKLFESIGFKLNKEDTATTSQQGFVKIASDANTISRTSNATNDFTAAVVPHQLPEVISALTINDTEDSFTIVDNIRIASVTRSIGGNSRRVYMINNAVSFISKFLRQNFAIRTNTVLSLITGSGGQQFSFPIKTGKSYRFYGKFFVDTNIAGGIKVRVAGSAGASVGNVLYSIKVFESLVGLVNNKIIEDFGVTFLSTVNTTNKLIVEIDGTIICTANGNLDFQAAQSVSDPYANAAVLIGSTAIVEEVIF